MIFNKNGNHASFLTLDKCLRVRFKLLGIIVSRLKRKSDFPMEIIRDLYRTFILNPSPKFEEPSIPFTDFFLVHLISDPETAKKLFEDFFKPEFVSTANITLPVFKI